MTIGVQDFSYNPRYYPTNKIELTVREDRILELTSTICEEKGSQILPEPYQMTLGCSKSRDIVYSSSIAAREYF